MQRMIYCTTRHTHCIKSMRELFTASDSEYWLLCRRLSLRVQAALAFLQVLYSEVEALRYPEAPLLLDAVRSWIQRVHQLDPLTHVSRLAALRLVRSGVH